MQNESFRYSFRMSSRESLGLSVYSCGFQKCASLHSWGPAVRDHYLIHYITSGKGVFEVGGKKHELKAGDLFLISPSQLAYYCANEDDPWEYYWVAFSGADAQRLILNTGMSLENPIIHYGKIPDIQMAFLNIYHSKGKTAKDEATMIGRFYLLFSLLIEHGENINHSEISGWDHVQAAIKYINYNYSNDISIDDIAESASVSRSHLYRLFMKHLSMSPTEYLTQFRISYACTLLRQKKLSVGEAAMSAGFRDQLYFSRIFKKIKGITPSKYKSSDENLQEEEL